jgi:ubiquinone/menaquinone biosynthesis C-methylase UbiE
LLHVLPEARSILDVGCRSGEWLSFVLSRRSFDRHLGIDLSEEYVGRARRLHPTLNVQVRRAEDIDPEGESFDVVTCLEVLEHIPQWEDVLRTLLGIADRQVLVTVPYRERIIQTQCIHCGKITPVYGHLHSFAEDSFPDVEGWHKRCQPLRKRDPELKLRRKLYRMVKPRYAWLLVDYRRTDA